MKTHLRLLCFVPFLLSLGGCPVWSGDTAKSGSPSDCVTDGDCATGEACRAGSCTPTGGCTSDAQCLPAEHCDFRGTCVSDTASGCRSNAECAVGSVCVEGSCRDTGPSTCQFDLECGAGQVCVDNACTNACSGNAQCGSGQVCSGGRCEADPTECLSSADCPGSDHCVDGRCLAGCTSGSCPDSDDFCDADGFCRPDWRPRAFCTSDQDCAVGSTCELATGICRVACDPTSALVTGYTPTSCSQATADCACQSSDAQFVSCGLPSGVDDYCRTQSELVSDCASQADCTTSQSCVNGRCQ